MGNLGVSAKSNQKFTVTTGHASKFDAATNLNVTDARSKARPSTEVGRMRARRATEPMMTTDIQGQDGPLAD